MPLTLEEIKRLLPPSKPLTVDVIDSLQKLGLFPFEYGQRLIGELRKEVGTRVTAVRGTGPRLPHFDPKRLAEMREESVRRTAAGLEPREIPGWMLRAEEMRRRLSPPSAATKEVQHRLQQRLENLPALPLLPLLPMEERQRLRPWSQNPKVVMAGSQLSTASSQMSRARGNLRASTSEPMAPLEKLRQINETITGAIGGVSTALKEMSRMGVR